MLRAFGGGLGDFRDWPQIDAWAESIGAEKPAPKAAGSDAKSSSGDQ
jgi:hypothetical protein